MKLSIVTTLYKSSATIRDFHARITRAIQGRFDDYEIIMVDDGSPDDSLAVAVSLLPADPRLSVIEFARNFGHHRAMMTGLAHARGDLVFLIDVDLEEPPELLLQFHDQLRASQADVVYGFQVSRKGGVIERLTGDLAYRAFKLLIPYPIPRNHITVRLMTRTYVRELVRHREREMVIGGLWAITGFKQQGLAVEKGSRKQTSYNLMRKMHAFIESITSFSERPLIVVFYLGLVIMLVSSGVAFWLLILGLGGAILHGWVSIMLSVWFLGGMLIFCIGLVGLYVSRIFIETKRRPYSIIRRIHAAEQPREGR